MQARAQSSLEWRKSSYSGPTSNCVEVAFTGPVVGVRDTKNRNGGSLMIPADRWQEFVRTLQ